MIDRMARKAALSSYKERKVVAGVYAVRCKPSGECWVGQTPDLSKIQNRIWFSLRHGRGRHPALQAAWQEHGADAFAFEVVEELADQDELSAYVRAQVLKARHAFWLKELGARAI